MCVLKYFKNFHLQLHNEHLQFSGIKKLLYEFQQAKATNPKVVCFSPFFFNQPDKHHLDQSGQERLNHTISVDSSSTQTKVSTLYCSIIVFLCLFMNECVFVFYIFILNHLILTFSLTVDKRSGFFHTFKLPSFYIHLYLCIVSIILCPCEALQMPYYVETEVLQANVQENPPKIA